MRAGPLSVLLLRLGLVAAVYTALRLLFVWHNAALFPHVPWSAYLGGIRFDLFAIAWLHLPWVLLVLIAPRRPVAENGYGGTRAGRAMERVQLGLFLLASALGLVLNTVDVGYYAFTLKRSTSDLFNIIGAGGDMLNLGPAFLRDYWYLALAFVMAMALVAWGYRRLGRLNHGRSISIPWRIGWRVLAIGLLVLASRGGIQLIPLQPLDAARYGGAAYLPVVLNTPYTMLVSLGKPTLAERNYMPQKEADALWPVVHDMRTSFTAPLGYAPWDAILNSFRIPTDEDTLPEPPEPEYREPAPRNVVIVILESFSAAYSAELAGGEGHMPFLDSLMRESLHFTRAYANGRRSIDGIPAILASIPHLMDEAFITSPYASHRFTSLASVLGAEGYHTSFFHGGRNGTMGFDGFTRSAGFQRYAGMDEYPGGKADFDGHWGIRDRPFLQFWAQELEKEQGPFLSVAFTLSSHHPYHLPKEDAERFAAGTQPIHPTLRYTDDALRRFFATARTMPWYGNTVFVITADHTADLERTGQHSDKAIDHWVPLVVHAPGCVLPHKFEGITQHIDILPMVLELAGYSRPFFSFGHSPLRPGPRYAVMANNGIYHIISDRMQLQFDGTEVIGMRSLDGHSADTTLAADMERHLKAAIQQFNHHLLRGTLVADPATE